MHIILLSQENIELSTLEAASLLELDIFTREDNMIFSNIKKKESKKIPRLAYTKKILELLFMCNPKDLALALERFDFSKIYEKNFCLRIHDENHQYKDADYAKYVWRSLESKKIRPKVDLDNPKTLVEVIMSKDRAFVCRQVWTNEKGFEQRKAHLKPELHPTAMHPRMASALINILNPKVGERIIDPFCGAGGIIAESALMGIKSVGYDIDEIQLRRAKINLSRLKGYSLKRFDALKLKDLRNVVTDLPYGKSSKKTDEINSLYAGFIRNISGRAVIVFPHFSDYKNILKNNLKKGLEVKNIIGHYVHKSLTRKIVLVDKK